MKPVSIAVLVALCIAVAGCAGTPRFEAYPDGQRSNSFPPPGHDGTPLHPWQPEGDLYPRIVFPF